MKILVEIEIEEGNSKEETVGSIKSVLVNGEPAKYNNAMFDDYWYTIHKEDYDNETWEIQLLQQWH